MRFVDLGNGIKPNIKLSRSFRDLERSLKLLRNWHVSSVFRHDRRRRKHRSTRGRAFEWFFKFKIVIETQLTSCVRENIDYAVAPR
jgi:hypothetical protein